MIALDTNVLVRVFIDDDADEATRRQNARARTFVSRLVTSGERLFVSDVVLCESVWVLRSKFRLRRDAVRQFLTDLTRTESLEFADRERLARALTAFATGNADFADYLIREYAREAGCEHVATFDEVLQHEDGFVAP